MIAPLRRVTFDELEQEALGGETPHFELKNSAFVILAHSGNQNKKDDCGNHKPIATASMLRTECKKMLAKECGAFANSAGGTLVIGFEDDGTLDTVTIQEKYATSNQDVDDWVASLIRDCLEPPLEVFYCYSVPTNAGGYVLVVEVPVSEKRPHQAEDFRYYIREEKSAKPAAHWVVEMIRNRRIYPRLEPQLLLDESGVYGSSQDETLTLNLIFSVTNHGSVLAEKWAFRFDCHFAQETRVLPELDYPHLNLPTERRGGTWMVKAVNPLFPTQSVKFIVRLIVPAHWRIDETTKSLSEFQWRGINRLPLSAGGPGRDGMNQFSLDLSVFADSAPLVSNRYSIEELDFWEKMVRYLRSQGAMS